MVPKSQWGNDIARRDRGSGLSGKDAKVDVRLPFPVRGAVHNL